MKIRQIAVAGGTSLLLLAGLSFSSLAASIPQPKYPAYTKHVTITWWSWLTDANGVVKDFEKAYPTIKVDHVQVPGSEYTKLTTVLKAGSGAPDDVMLEYQVLPQFINSGGLLNISKYDGYMKPFFYPWTWNQVTVGNKLYAIPEDIAPMGMYYQTKLFAKYHLTVPKTWTEFAADAAKFHKEAPHGQYFAHFNYTDGAWIISLLWQAGVYPFHGSGNNWKVDFDTPTAQRVLNFWGNLIKKGYVQATNGGPQQQHELAAGNFATLVAPSWYPAYVMNPVIKPGTQTWSPASIPQWGVHGPFVDSNFGGSTVAVTVQTKHPRAAAIFAAWYNTSAAGMHLSLVPANLGGGGYIPADKYAVYEPNFKATVPALHMSAPFPLFEQGAAKVDASFQWSPWTTYVYSAMGTEFEKSVSGKESWSQALSTVQQDVMQFGKTQGYTVSP